MTIGPWKPFYAENFFDPVLEWADKLEAALKEGSRGKIEEGDLLAHDRELNEFVLAIDLLSNPPAELDPVSDEQGRLIPDVYVLRRGRWSAYYLVNINVPAFLAMLAVHDSQSLRHDIMRMIETFMKGGFPPVP